MAQSKKGFVKNRPPVVLERLQKLVSPKELNITQIRHVILIALYCLTPELKRHIFRYLITDQPVILDERGEILIRHAAYNPRVSSGPLRHGKKITSINHVIFHHILTSSSGLGLVNRVRLVPVVRWDEAKLNLAVSKLGDAPITLFRVYAISKERHEGVRLEIVREWLVIQENIGIPKFLVESVLHLFHAANDAVNIAKDELSSGAGLHSFIDNTRTCSWPT
jgi:hypothetical protein